MMLNTIGSENLHIAAATLNVVLRTCWVLGDNILAFVAESINICPMTQNLHDELHVCGWPRDVEIKFEN